MTIKERAKLNLQYERDFLGNNLSENMVCRAYVKGATEQEEIDKANPSDEVIMRVLNAIGYEEESWLPVVKERLKSMKEHGQD